MPGDSRLKPSTQRAFGSRKKRAWNKKAPATSAPSAAELESRPDPLDLPGTSTDDTVGPSSTSETLRVDAAYYSTAEQAQRVERSAQTKTVLSGKSATQRKFDLLGVSAECQTGFKSPKPVYSATSAAVAQAPYALYRLWEAWLQAVKGRSRQGTSAVSVQGT
ncbi:hypothetical protein HPB52_014360 [Rhipicephalus sanguineus]|uniref:Uncharacterized protein n=1 Tax=Rhipicephalus sanguineus TaxID=34632 RepID=A0A9D4TAC6_RHISA|nr:hypothetical protein HPB52_014360 [Rhipicephalus sanguineus]